MFEQYIEEEKIEEQPKDPYLAAREEADVMLHNFEFIKKEDIIQIKPEKFKDETPVFVSPGWGSIPKMHLENLEAIAEEGREVISVPFSREQKIEERNGFIAEFQKALTIIEAIDKSGASQVDAIGHSEGGLNLALAASLHPEKFRSIVLVGAAGMVGKDSYFDLVKRFTIDEGIKEFKMREQSNMNSFFGYMKGILKYMAHNPLLAHQEIKEISQADIFEMTRYLKEKGVGVGVICGVNDQVFPIERVLKSLDEKKIDHFLSTKGNHGSFVFNKEHAALAEELLSLMAKEREGK
ncbi:MAG: alpha/beta fold hydrolase [Candidatus Paceibacterota bacterium]|jgi:hypothetical protein